MGLGKENTALIYSMFEEGLQQTLNISIPKGKKKIMLDGFVLFYNAAREKTGMNLSHDVVIDMFGEYVVYCMSQFKKWSEAGAHNWIAYVCSKNRQAAFLHKFSLNKTDVAGKESKDAWNF